MRGDTQPDTVAYFRQLEERFVQLGLEIQLTNRELFLIRGPEGSENQEACNVRTLHELEAYLRGVEAMEQCRIPVFMMNQIPQVDVPFTSVKVEASPAPFPEVVLVNAYHLEKASEKLARLKDLTRHEVSYSKGARQQIDQLFGEIQELIAIGD